MISLIKYFSAAVIKWLHLCL